MQRYRMAICEGYDMTRHSHSLQSPTPYLVPANLLPSSIQKHPLPHPLAHQAAPTCHSAASMLVLSLLASAHTLESKKRDGRARSARRQRTHSAGGSSMAGTTTSPSTTYLGVHWSVCGVCGCVEGG